MGAMTRTVDRQRAISLAAAVAHDELAFRRIIAEHHDDMRRVAAYITRDRTLAEEARQRILAVLDEPDLLGQQGAAE